MSGKMTIWDLQAKEISDAISNLKNSPPFYGRDFGEAWKEMADTVAKLSSTGLFGPSYPGRASGTVATPAKAEEEAISPPIVNASQDVKNHIENEPRINTDLVAQKYKPEEIMEMMIHLKKNVDFIVEELKKEKELKSKNAEPPQDIIRILIDNLQLKREPINGRYHPTNGDRQFIFWIVENNYDDCLGPDNYSLFVHCTIKKETINRYFLEARDERKRLKKIKRHKQTNPV